MGKLACVFKSSQRLALALAFALAGAAPAAAAENPAATAADPQAYAAAQNLMRVTKATALTQQMMGTSLRMVAQLLEQTNPGAKVGPIVRELVQPEMEKRLPELLEELTRVYTRHFSASEMNEMIAFYETALGKKIVKTMPLLMTESMNVGGNWGAKAAQESLAKVAPKMRERGLKI